MLFYCVPAGQPLPEEIAVARIAPWACGQEEQEDHTAAHPKAISEQIAVEHVAAGEARRGQAAARRGASPAGTRGATRQCRGDPYGTNVRSYRRKVDRGTSDFAHRRRS